MKWWYWLVVGGFLAVAGWWVSRYLTTAPPGQRLPDMGREHVTPAQVAETSYNSNPPTSGPHLPSWVKAGIYDQPQAEGELIHSLEHGYIIISYNCGVHLKGSASSQLSVVSLVFAHDEGSPAAEPNLPQEATGSAINESPACQTLIGQLKELANKKKLWKLIVVPRPRLGTTLALTAWNYIDKSDTFDAKRIEHFIDYYRDQGPEKTME